MGVLDIVPVCTTLYIGISLICFIGWRFDWRPNKKAFRVCKGEQGAHIRLPNRSASTYRSDSSRSPYVPEFFLYCVTHIQPRSIGNRERYRIRLHAPLHPFPQNVTSSSTANAVLEAARDIKSPIIIQASQGGSAYFAGKGLPNGNQEASIVGAIAAAKHVRTVAKSYGM